MQKILPLLALVAALAGCATPADNYNPPQGVPQARIRIFSGGAITVQLARDCSAPEEKFNAYSGMFADNRVIGMPKSTDMSDQPNSYNEYAIPAGYRVKLVMSFYQRFQSNPGQYGFQKTTTRSCGPLTVGFVPQEGKDYDANLLVRGNRCYTSLRELTPSGEGIATAKPISGGLPACGVTSIVPKDNTSNTGTRKRR